VTTPLVDSQSRYCPLKQVSNSSQYTLGRVFLQAYVVANYEFSNFSVAQAAFPSSSATEQLVPIESSGFTVTSQKASAGLSTGAIAGIAVGAVAGVGLLVAGIRVWLWRLRRQRKRQTPPAADSESDMDNKAPLGQQESQSPYPGQAELHDHVQIYEANHAAQFRPEMEGQSKAPPEMEGQVKTRPEFYGDYYGTKTGATGREHTAAPLELEALVELEAPM
jgi:hypothetical protein